METQLQTIIKISTDIVMDQLSIAVKIRNSVEAIQPRIAICKDLVSIITELSVLDSSPNTRAVDPIEEKRRRMEEDAAIAIQQESIENALKLGGGVTGAGIGESGLTGYLKRRMENAPAQTSQPDEEKAELDLDPHPEVAELQGRLFCRQMELTNCGQAHGAMPIPARSRLAPPFIDRCRRNAEAFDKLKPIEKLRVLKRRIAWTEDAINRYTCASADDRQTALKIAYARANCVDQHASNPDMAGDFAFDLVVGFNELGRVQKKDVIKPVELGPKWNCVADILKDSIGRPITADLVKVVSEYEKTK